MFRSLLIFGLFLGGLLGCSPSNSDIKRTSPRVSAASNQVFQVKGTVKELDSDGKTVTIRHEEIPNYMPAMVMDFTARNPRDLSGLRAGDELTFRLTVTGDDFWIDQISKAGATPTNSPFTNAPIQIMRDVEPLQIGDPLPEYHFTNELARAVSTSEFKGKAVAITFIFTRCPLPTFCPRMSSNFEEVQKKLLAATNAPANWHLLTISFDPEFDSPAIMKSYAQRYQADASHWNFLTGSPLEISGICDQLGQKFWKEEGAINHNLRTAVFDATGRLQQLFQGNSWSADDIIAELTKGASAR